MLIVYSYESVFQRHPSGYPGILFGRNVCFHSYLASFGDVFLPEVSILSSVELLKKKTPLSFLYYIVTCKETLSLLVVLKLIWYYDRIINSLRNSLFGFIIYTSMLYSEQAFVFSHLLCLVQNFTLVCSNSSLVLNVSLINQFNYESYIMGVFCIQTRQKTMFNDFVFIDS